MYYNQLMSEPLSFHHIIPSTLPVACADGFVPEARRVPSAGQLGADTFVPESARGRPPQQEIVLSPRVVQRMQELVAERRVRQPDDREEQAVSTRTMQSTSTVHMRLVLINV